MCVCVCVRKREIERKPQDVLVQDRKLSEREENAGVAALSGALEGAALDSKAVPRACLAVRDRE